MKVGLFFGSFNPIHIGHLIIANMMVNITDLDEVWFVVSPQNPLKKYDPTLLPASERLLMVKKAIEGNNKLHVTDIEFNMPRPSYTINTLMLLREKYQQHTFFLIIGEDNLISFGKWKEYDKIIENFQIYVYPRIKSDSDNQSKSMKYEVSSAPLDKRNLMRSNINIIDAPMLDISSSLIRRYVKKGESIKYLVSEAVEAWLLKKKL
ncbi:MAG: nicotinate-nucleotide adenylyltransferase [Cytophagales bacterium]|nr:nicotinate-nucleotide adenylyltransferase [Cytophagales bacterium]